MRAVFGLVRSKRNVYHPRMEGTICDAIREARVRCVEDRAGVSVIWHPYGGIPSTDSRRVARVPWSKIQGHCLPVKFDYVPLDMKVDVDREGGCR